mmetsp:Transcript_13053/g.24381  ORF Transcript_13053/g.24381 Transcript_13053/m.24381 type:complete len:412 (-) Transcript_13053:118-1353(-)
MNMDSPCRTVLRIPKYTVTFELTRASNDFVVPKPAFKVSPFDTTVERYIPIDTDPEMLTKQRKHFIENKVLLSKLVKNHMVKQAYNQAYVESKRKEAHKKWIARANSIEQFRAAGVSQEKQRKEDLMFNKYQYAFDPNRFQKEKATLLPREIGLKSTRTFVPVKDPLAEHEAYKKTNVWTEEDIRAFLEAYFDMPKKFSDIQKFVCTKKYGQIVQSFFLMKYPLLLKKRLRLHAKQFRVNKNALDLLINEDIEEVIEDLNKAFGTKRLKFTDQDLCKLSQHNMHQASRNWAELSASERLQESIEHAEYYGKNMSFLSPCTKTIKEYERYKEYAFGGEQMTDEGFIDPSETRKVQAIWSIDEKMKFIELLKIHKRDWKAIAAEFEGKSINQCKNFFQNYKKKLNLEAIEAQP